MLLHVLLPALLITIAQASPTLHSRGETIFPDDSLEASANINYGEKANPDDNDYEKTYDDGYPQPSKIAMVPATKPPVGFTYTSTGEYDGYCLTSYTECKLCQQNVGCFPADRVSGTEQGKTVWLLCESDVSTPPCADDLNKVFTKAQFDDGQR